jgi:hypothetical protein
MTMIDSRPKAAARTAMAIVAPFESPDFDEDCDELSVVPAGGLWILANVLCGRYSLEVYWVPEPEVVVPEPEVTIPELALLVFEPPAVATAPFAVVACLT